uniref:Uncharacterized protein n=1 Tax=Macrostomum lignano TaxID=282301 RepID=A0A1I8FIA4_9PLAT
MLANQRRVSDRMRQKLQRTADESAASGQLGGQHEPRQTASAPAQLLRANRASWRLLALRRWSSRPLAAPTEGELPHWDYISAALQTEKRRNNLERFSSSIAREWKNNWAIKDSALLRTRRGYNENFIDLWTHSLSVQSRPFGLLKDLLRPVFTADWPRQPRRPAGHHRLLRQRHSTGRQRTKGPRSPCSMLTPVIELYEAGITELFVQPLAGLQKRIPRALLRSPADAKGRSVRAQTKPANTSNKKREPHQSRFSGESAGSGAVRTAAKQQRQHAWRPFVSESD